MRARAASLLAFLTGCATVSPGRGHEEVSALVAERAGQPTGWSGGAPAEAELASRVEELLAGGLTSDVAVAVALLNSPDLQALYEELGIAQADLVQAGLLRNPRLSVSWLLGLGGAGYEAGASLVQDLLSALVLPLPRRLAEEEFEGRLLRVADQALELVANVRQAVAELQGLAAEVDLARTAVDAEGAAAELALRLRRAGNITELELAEQTAAFQQARLELSRLELERWSWRERLNRQLGLWGELARWELAEDLPALPALELETGALEAVAIRERLDLQAARLRVELLTRATDLAKTLRLVGEVSVGVEGSRETDGERLLGPTLTLELPIFDQRQALLARLEAQVRRAARRVAGRAVGIRSDVRLVSARMQIHRQQAEHVREVLAPLRRRALDQAQLQYNAMQIGLFRLLGARREQLQANRMEVQAVRDYWVAHAELERVMGGRTGEGPGQQPALESPSRAEPAPDPRPADASTSEPREPPTPTPQPQPEPRPAAEPAPERDDEHLGH